MYVHAPAAEAVHPLCPWSGYGPAVAKLVVWVIPAPIGSIYRLFTKSGSYFNHFSHDKKKKADIRCLCKLFHNSEKFTCVLVYLKMGIPSGPDHIK